MFRYEIIPFWSKEDNAFVADVPELPGCVAHGNTQEVAIKSIQEAASDWVEVAGKTEGSITEPRGRVMYA